MIIRQSEANTQINLDDPELFLVYKNCPICNSTSIEPSIKSHDNHYGVGGEYQHYKCKNCLALFLNPMPTEKFLSGAYPTEYYAYQELKADSPGKALLRKILLLENKTKDPVFERPGVMLDIGCGSGDFLVKMSKSGWETFGVEPSETAALIASKYPGLIIHNGTLISAHYPERKFDYVRTNHSLEHIPNPHDNLKEIARIIKPGGKLFIGVPNTESYAFNMYRENWWCLGAPQHTINYNEPSLKALVLPYGFKVISVRTNSNFTGLLGSYQIKLNNRNNKWSDMGRVLDFIPFRTISTILSKIADSQQKGDCLEMVFEKV